ncbi:MAG: hypothetical protein QOH18_4 [Solirubrobacterales bacterium]|nr:hypothetical protein [Solirubrobacterales bacterium]
MFITLRTRIRRTFLLGCVSGAALLALPVGQASAASYPNGGSTFTGGAEGWKVTSAECKAAGLLEIATLCGTAGSGYDGTAGAPAGSFANKAQIPVSAVGLLKAAYSDESPAFTVVAGGSGSLSLSRQFIPGGLASLTPTFTYTAFLVDKSTNTKQKAITETLEAEAPFATKSGAVSLTAGDTYVVQIEASTTASSLLGLLSETASRFDNVVVTSPNGTGGNPGEEVPGNHGNNGTDGEGGNGNGGAGSVSAARLESLMQSSLIGPAVLKGNKLTVKAKCPAKLKATCTLAITGMLSKKKPATTARKAKVKKGKTKSFALKVKPAALAKVKTKKKLLFMEQAKVGKSKVTVYKTLKLVRR